MKHARENLTCYLPILGMAAALTVLPGCAALSTAEADGAEKALAKVAVAGKTGEEAEAHYKSMRTEPEQGAPVAAKRKMVCDNIGKVIICTDGKSVCWWGPKNGYGCVF